MKKYTVRHKTKDIAFETGYVFNREEAMIEILRYLGKGIYTQNQLDIIKKNYRIRVCKKKDINKEVLDD